MALNERYLGCADCGWDKFTVKIISICDVAEHSTEEDWWFTCDSCGRRFVVPVMKDETKRALI